MLFLLCYIFFSFMFLVSSIWFSLSTFNLCMMNIWGRHSDHKISPPESKCLQMRFLNNISEPVYTGIPIKGEGTCLRVALVDAHGGIIVKSGPEASAEVGIHVIDKSFDKNDGEDWTPDEFKTKILGGRQGKLGGATNICLKEGVGCVDGIFFCHTKVPLSKIEVRLGAKIVNVSEGVRIREAITEPFTVRDRRGIKKKDYTLSLHDKVWRLKSIGRDGPFHRKLSTKNINTVADFLTEFSMNPQGLRDILGKSMSAKHFEAAVNHAQTCKRNLKDHYFSPASEQDAGVMLKNVGEGLCPILNDNNASNHFPSYTTKGNANKVVDEHILLMHGSSCPRYHLVCSTGLNYASSSADRNQYREPINSASRATPQSDCSGFQYSGNQYHSCGQSLSFKHEVPPLECDQASQTDNHDWDAFPRFIGDDDLQFEKCVRETHESEETAANRSRMPRDGTVSCGRAWGRRRLIKIFCVSRWFCTINQKKKKGKITKTN
ncbi:hypothetical protein ACH5RR_025642 [Cinchona calisaya]|uniref:Calmodulin-binding protein n=1 Tax=Cinchona calisaya TaxID=153742 RepID=A0ABD2Z3K8_9GENT